jgi:hypothetical protein
MTYSDCQKTFIPLTARPNMMIMQCNKERSTMSGNNNQYDDDKFAQLTAMGFEAVKVQEALNAVNGNVDQAVHVLLGGAIPPQQQQQQPESSSLIHCAKSQYSVENGRSACTCIALMGAALFLSSGETISVSSELLENMIDMGVAAYQQLPVSGTNVEHLSAEEVLQSKAIEQFKSLVLMEGGVRQGVLSGQANHPLGLGAILQECLSPDTWVAALITKPPETVVVLLPPTSQASGEYILLDSHPRPGLSHGSYARIHASLEDLVQSLQAIYPVTQLGNDIPEMMAMMYNSFDVYPLTWRTTPAAETETPSAGATES